MTAAAAPAAPAEGHADAPAEAQAPMAPLREDLWLYPGPRQNDGAPSWTLHDPVRNRFFRLGWTEFDLLSQWGPYTPDALLARVNRRGHRPVSAGDVTVLHRFLTANNLLQATTPDAVRALAVAHAQGRQSTLNWLLHRYLFLRVPLVRPDRWLSRLAPRLRFLFQPTFFRIVALITLVGLYLAIRQWDQFVATFLYFFSVEGALWYGLALIFAKIIHEMGHAITAKHYGVRVPTMGVAFIVFWPVLYTDATEAWKLPNRRPRLAIGAAGMMAELMLAGLATFLWAFLPDGPLRSAAFLVATITWVMTLVVNLNPFMRFDGYYLLSDLTDAPNLQDRSFRMGKWWLRRTLWGFADGAPEPLTAVRRAWFVFYAFCVWLYRLVLFLGIAFLVYSFFVKIIGIFLFLIEIWWFIARPIVREMAEWWRGRAKMRLTRRSGVCWLLLAGLIVLAAVPWRGSVDAPAFLRAARQTQIFAPEPARIAAILVRQGQRVRAGQVLFRLSSPALTHKVAQAKLEIAALRQQVRQLETDQRLLDGLAVLQQRLAERQRALAGLQRRQARLSVRAPFAGDLVRLPDRLTVGRWVAPTRRLAILADRRQPVLEAFLSEADLRRVQVGARAVFIPDRAGSPGSADVVARLVSVDRASLAVLSPDAMASVYGGPVAARRNQRGQLVPNAATYRARLALAPSTGAPSTGAPSTGTPSTGAPSTKDPPPWQLRRQQRGSVRIAARAESLLYRVFVSVSAVLVRESGF